MSKQVRHLYEFGPFRIDTANRLLLRDGQPVPLKPKVVETLLVLIENSGRVMKKDELIEKLWPDSYVEEGNLTQNIYELRKVLDSSGEPGSYIETIPRRGYRFAAQVKKLPYEESAPLIAGHDEAISGVVQSPNLSKPETEPPQRELMTPAPAPRAGARVFNRWVLISAVLLVGILIGGFYYLYSRRARPVANNEIKSLAILPFKSLNPGAADEYIGHGIADALITKLSNSHSIVVRPTSAVLRYSALDTNPLVAGRELSVDAVLDGKVQQLGERVRVTVQLLRVADGSSLWAEKFDTRLTDIFALQDSISDQAAHSLTLRLTGDERELMRKHYTQNFEAYQAYLQGRYFWNKRNASAFKTAIEHFEHAIKIDSNYALAYAGLADCYIRLNESGVPMAEASVPQAKEAVLTALRIDDRLAEAHATLGFIKFRHDWDFTGAEQEFQRSIELDANYSEAHQWYAFYLLAAGQKDKAYAEMSRARSLDPLSISFNANFGLYLFFTRQFDQSVQQCRKTLEMEPDSILARTALGLSYEQQGLYQEAIDELKKGQELSADAGSLAALGHALAKSGNVKDARDLLRSLEQRAKSGYVAPYSLAMLHVGLGENEQALVWLERAYQDRSLRPLWLKSDPRLDSLRQSGKLAGLIQRVGLKP